MTKANAKASSSRSTLPKQADEVKQPRKAPSTGCAGRSCP